MAFAGVRDRFRFRSLGTSVNLGYCTIEPYEIEIIQGSQRMCLGQHVLFGRIGHDIGADVCQAAQRVIGSADAQVHLLPPGVYIERGIIVCQGLEVAIARLTEVGVRLPVINSSRFQVLPP